MFSPLLIHNISFDLWAKRTISIYSWTWEWISFEIQFKVCETKSKLTRSQLEKPLYMCKYLCTMISIQRQALFTMGKLNILKIRRKTWMIKTSSCNCNQKFVFEFLKCFFTTYTPLRSYCWGILWRYYVRVEQVGQRKSLKTRNTSNLTFFLPVINILKICRYKNKQKIDLSIHG